MESFGGVDAVPGDIPVLVVDQKIVGYRLMDKAHLCYSAWAITYKGEVRSSTKSFGASSRSST
jgi:hypothetical protein